VTDSAGPNNHRADNGTGRLASITFGVGGTGSQCEWVFSSRFEGLPHAPLSLGRGVRKTPVLAAVQQWEAGTPCFAQRVSTCPTRARLVCLRLPPPAPIAGGGQAGVGGGGPSYRRHDAAHCCFSTTAAAAPAWPCVSFAWAQRGMAHVIRSTAARHRLSPPVDAYECISRLLPYWSSTRTRRAL